MQSEQRGDPRWKSLLEPGSSDLVPFSAAPGPFLRAFIQRELPYSSTFQEGVDRLFFTARIERAHSYRARSASKKNGLPAPSSRFFDRYCLPLWSGFSDRSENRIPGRRAILEWEFQQRIGIHTGAVEFDAPMEMRAGGAAGRSYLADDLPRLHQIPVFDKNVR